MIRTYDYDGSDYEIACKLDSILDGMIEVQTIVSKLKEELMRLVCLGTEKYDTDENIEDTRKELESIERSASSVVQYAYWVVAKIPKGKEEEVTDGNEKG